MSAPPHLTKYCEYIRNTGQVPLTAAAFDDDWDPIGHMVRSEMDRHGLITQADGCLILTDAGKALL